MTQIKKEIDSESHHTLEEVSTFIHNVSNEDMVRISKIEERFSRNDPANTLLVDAIEKTLNGTRKWKKGLGIVEHLYGVIKSLANNEYKKKLKKPVSINIDHSDEQNMPLMENQSSFEETILRTEDDVSNVALANQIFKLFEDDEEITWILLGLSEGNSASEIQAASGMSKTTYESARKRMRRKIGRNF